MSWRVRRSFWRFAMALALSGVCAACGSDGGPAPVTTATALVLPQVPAPAGLAVTWVIGKPEDAWEKTRNAAGGPALFLPKGFGALVALSLGFPLTAGQEIDGRTPCVGAIAASDDARSLGGVVAIHALSPDRLANALTKGDGARFRATPGPVANMTILAPIEAVPDAPPVAIGILGHYLLVGRTVADLERLGPYAAGTLPVTMAAAHDAARGNAPDPSGAEAPDLRAEVTALALSGPAKAAALRFHSGLASRAADMGLPDTFATQLQPWMEAIGDIDGASLRLVLTGTNVSVFVDAKVKPASRTAAALKDVVLGDASPLLDLPADTLAALLVRRRPSGEGAKDAGPDPLSAEILKTLGPLPDADTEAIGQIGRDLDAAAGTWIAAGAWFNGTGPAAYIRADVASTDRLDAALKGLATVWTKKPVEARLTLSKLDVKASRTVLENVPGDVLRLRVGKRGAKASAVAAAGETPGAIDLLLTRRGSTFAAATGYASRDALRAVVAAPPNERLRAQAWIASTFELLRDKLAIAAMIDPVRWSAARAGTPGSVSPSPILAASGTQQDGAIWAWVGAPLPAIVEAGRIAGVW